MPKITYVNKVFSNEHQTVIGRANEVITAYAAQGYDLTLRQLYYQFVSRDWMANNDKNYKRLGTIISDARRAGLIDWDRIVDRTRFVRKPPAWGGPDEIIAACARQFSIDFWANQHYRPEVWIEKDALVGVLEVACEPWHVPYFSCRGYTSDSEAWAAGRRVAQTLTQGQTPIIFHLGDHDPSGIDMSRDIRDRINLFCADVCKVEVRRIALTMDQIEEVQPPPNPAKTTDARFTKYAELYGDESWELDALNPDYIGNLIAEHMREIVGRLGNIDGTSRRGATPALGRVRRLGKSHGGTMNPLAGIPIRTDDTLTETKFVQYRPDRFIEYEETDSRMLYEGWAEFRQIPSTKVYQIGGKFLMHPAMLKKIRETTHHA